MPWNLWGALLPITLPTHFTCLPTCRCNGHSGNVEHIDWSLPISLPGSKLHGEMILQATDTSGNLLYWNPKTGVLPAFNTCRQGSMRHSRAPWTQHVIQTH